MAIRRFYFFIVICLLSLFLIGCSSSDVEEETIESPTTDFEGEGSLESEEEEDVAELEGELNLEEEEGDFGEEDFGELPEDSLDQEEPSSIGDLPDTPVTEEDPSTIPEFPAEPLAETDESLSPPVADDPSFATGGETVTPDFGDSAFSPSFDTPSVPQRIPVKKIKTYPFTRGGILANAVYIARSGDNLSSISQTIYGNDRTSELLTVNPNLHRGVDVGDKVYYNSPNRPQDGENLFFYYEDIGAIPQQHTTSRNENIRDLAESLFGERESWKELWATNPDVQSKWTLPAGLVLRHWANASVSGGPPMPMAGEQPPPAEEIPPVQEEQPPFEEVPDVAMDTTQGDLPPPPDIPQPPPGAEDLPPDFPPPDEGPQGPPPFDQNAGGDPPPPPPPPPDLGMGEVPVSADDGALGMTGDDESLLLLLIGVVIMMFVLLIAIRKRSKRRRKMRVDLGETQV